MSIRQISTQPQESNTDSVLEITERWMRSSNNDPSLFRMPMRHNITLLTVYVIN